MSTDNRHIDFTDDLEIPLEETGLKTKIPAEKEPSDKKSNPTKKNVRVKEIIDGTFLIRENVIRQLPFILFLTFLGIIYIGNRFHAESMVRKIEELKTEVGNLRSEQITISSELMNISRPSEVAALVESKGLGLKESMEPPKKLKR